MIGWPGAAARAGGLSLLLLAACAAPPDVAPAATPARRSGPAAAGVPVAAPGAGAAPADGGAALALGTADPSRGADAAPEPGSGLEIARGRASWYGKRFQGRRTASGERFDMHAMTAAHRSLPFGTRVLVRNLRNGREVEVRINDRGPHLRGRIIDLSHAAAAALGLIHAGDVTVVLLRP